MFKYKRAGENRLRFIFASVNNLKTARIMNTIIEKIRAEVERLMDKANKGDGSEYFNGAKHTLITLIGFLDTLQEQPWKDNALFDSCLAKVNPKTREEVRKNIDKMIEQPVSEGLEEEIDKRWREWLSDDKEQVEGVLPKSEFAFYARHFAQWGAEHRGGSEIPKDLESYAQKVEDYYDVGEERGYLCVQRGEVKDAVIAGASWQKEQMMKEAVEGEVFADHFLTDSKLFIESDYLPDGKFHVSDKVKLVIIKED